MIQQEVSYLDGEFDVFENVPSTIAELNEVGYTEDDVINSCIADIRYRNKYPRVYKAVAAEVEKLGFAKQVIESTTKEDGTVKEKKESDNNFLRRYLAADEANRATLQDLFNKVANEQPLYVKGERAGGGGKVSAQALEQANGVFSKGNEEAVAKHIESIVPGYKLARTAEGELTPESVARGISALQKHLSKNALANIG